MESHTMERLWEYRIRYNPGRGHAAVDNYHYFNATSAHEAYLFEMEMREHRDQDYQIISIERRCPYSNSWIDETEEAVAND